MSPGFDFKALHEFCEIPPIPAHYSRLVHSYICGANMADLGNAVVISRAKVISHGSAQ